MKSINANDDIWVQLTPIGRDHLERVPQEDKNGWSKWQLWELMGTFGDLLQYPSNAVPFRTEIRLTDPSKDYE